MGEDMGYYTDWLDSRLKELIIQFDQPGMLKSVVVEISNNGSVLETFHRRSKELQLTSPDSLATTFHLFASLQARVVPVGYELLISFDDQHSLEQLRLLQQQHPLALPVVLAFPS